MVGYNANLDNRLWSSEPSQDGLVIRIMKYGDFGEPKLAFIRSFETHSGEIKEKNAGRLTLSDITYFGQLWPDVNKMMKKIIEETKHPEPKYQDEIDPDIL